MAIAPLQIPQLGAVSGGMDFSPLANLGNVYRQAQQEQQKKEALSALAGGDPNSLDIRPLLASGDMSLAQLGINLRNRDQDLQRQGERDKIGDQHWAASYDLQKRSADRADEGPVEKAQQRARLLQQQGIDPNSPEGKAFIISGDWTGPGAGGASLNPVYGVNAKGEPAMVQTTKTGKAIQTELPEGFKIAKEPIKIDSGTHFTLLDPQTRQVIGTLPKNLAQVETQKVVGEETGKAQVALPQVMATSQQILKTIDDIQNHPGKGWSLGAYSKIPTIPGTEQANFRAATGQLKGQTFLQAYQTLRGGGAITDVEGAKGENALARLDQAQTTEAYDKALNDFKEVIHAGMLRAAVKARAGGGEPAAVTAPAQQPAQGAPGNVTSSGIKWSVQ